MKNRRDLINEYGMILRWINESRVDGLKVNERYFLENVKTGEEIEIKDQKAIEFIKEKTLNKFRNDTYIYNTHVELFKILGII